jgi:recombinational DNA repair protein (RecF pathway)
VDGCAYCHKNTGTLAVDPYDGRVLCTSCRKVLCPEGWVIPDDEAAKAEREADREEKEVWW